MKAAADFKIRPACLEDVPVILELIRDLATYERAPDDVVATEEQLVDVLFGERPVAEVLLAFEGESPVGFAVSSTISPRGWGGPDCISKICS